MHIYIRLCERFLGFCQTQKNTCQIPFLILGFDFSPFIMHMHFHSVSRCNPFSCHSGVDVSCVSHSNALFDISASLSLAQLDSTRLNSNRVNSISYIFPLHIPRCLALFAKGYFLSYLHDIVANALASDIPAFFYCYSLFCRCHLVFAHMSRK